MQMLLQCETMGVVVAFALFGAYVPLKLIGLVTPLRISAEDEDTGARH
jgi:ammonia channel protein AmtB